MRRADREEVVRLIEPVIDEMNLELVDIEYTSGHRRPILRVYIDKERGVTLDDCAMASEEIGRLLDVKDMIPHEYVLEVSSPGLNRPLTRDKDFRRAVGKKIKVKMASPVDGRRNFTGYLEDFREGMLYLNLQGQIVMLDRQDLEKANLVYDFESLRT